MTDLATKAGAQDLPDDDVTTSLDELEIDDVEAIDTDGDEAQDAEPDAAADGDTDAAPADAEVEMDAESDDPDARAAEDAEDHAEAEGEDDDAAADAEPEAESEDVDPDGDPVEPATDVEAVAPEAAEPEPEAETEDVEAEAEDDVEPEAEDDVTPEAGDDVEPEGETEDAVPEAGPEDVEPEDGTEDVEPEAETEDDSVDDLESAASVATEEDPEPAPAHDLVEEPVSEPVPVGAVAAAPVAASVAPPAPTVLPVPGPATHAEPEIMWAPAEPTRRKRHLGWWIGIPAALAIAALVAASLVLIAPGTSIAGVSVGGMTPGAAADAVSARLAETTLVIAGPDGDVEVTGAELAASVQARELANEAFDAHPMWNPTQWFSEPERAIVQLDPDVAKAVLRDAAPSLYTDPVDAQLAFDAESASYVVTPAILGTGIDVDAVRTALQDAFDSGQTRVEFDPVAAPIDAETQTYVADATAYRLNTMLDSMGFYIGGERVVPIDRALAASWITLGDGPRGTFSIEVDQQAIGAFVETLPALVNREPVNATVVTNSSGTVLRTLSEGVEGRTLESTDGIAAAFAEQIQNANGIYELPMTTIPFTTTALARTIEVNLSTQRAYLYENGNLVSSHVISSGLPGSATPAGHFTVNGYSRIQSMGCFEGAPYCVRDVPWVTWFAPDIGFHGANSLRSSLGYPQSHGCVNMWDNEARFVYEWSAYGTEVWVHY